MATSSPLPRVEHKSGYDLVYADGAQLNEAAFVRGARRWPITAARYEPSRDEWIDTEVTCEKKTEHAPAIPGVLYRFGVTEHAELEVRLFAAVVMSSPIRNFIKENYKENDHVEGWICADGVDLNEAREIVSAREGKRLIMTWPVVAYIQSVNSAEWVPSTSVYPGGRFPAEIGRLHRFRISSAPAFADVVQDRLRRRLQRESSASPKRCWQHAVENCSECAEWVHATGKEMNEALARYLARRPEAIGWPLTAETRSPGVQSQDRLADHRWCQSTAVTFGNQLGASSGYSYRFRAADSPGFYEALHDYRAAQRAEVAKVDAPAAPTSTPRPDPQNAREQGPSAVEQARGIVRKVLTVLPDDFSGDEFPDAPPSRGIVGARPAPPSPSAEWIDLAEEV